MLPRRFLLRFFDLFSRYFWLNVLPVILMTLAGVAFLLQPIYVSYGSIYVQRNTLLDDLVAIRIRDEPFNGLQVITPAVVVVNEFRELIETDAFAYAVIMKSDLSAELNGSPRQVQEVLKLYRESFSAEAEGPNLVIIRVEADSATLAQQFATASVDAYRSWKISKDVQDSKIAQTFFEEIVVPYREDVERAQEDLRIYLEQYPEPVVGARPVEEELQIRQLQDVIDLAEQRLKDILNKAESARLALAQTERDVDQTYKLVDVPVVPTLPEPFYAQILLALLFPLVGLLLSVGIVLGRCVADRTLLSSLDVRDELELPVLAEVRVGRAARSSKRVKEPAIASPRSDESLSGPVRL